MVGVGTVLVATTGCGGGVKPARGTAGAPTTTADPWAVPATITPGYLDRVLAVFDHLEGEADRDARANNPITPRFLELERSFRSSEAEVQTNVQVWQHSIQVGFANTVAVPGDPKDTVTQLLTTQAGCVVAAVTHDLSAQAKSPPAFPPWYVAAIPGAANALNPTHWVLADDGYRAAGPPSPQEACKP